MKQITFLFLITVFFSCKSKTPLEKALSSSSEKITRVLDNLESHEVQILFTEVVKNDDGSITFKDDSFQVDDNQYFYPASSVKFPVAVLALEKANEIDQIDRNTLFELVTDSIQTTITKEIEKIFAVSDNEAYNRLFDFVGKDEINKRLASKDINARLSHRVSAPNSGSTIMKSMKFFTSKDTIELSERIDSDTKSLSLLKTQKGVGFMKDGKKVNSPMDFSKKNYLPITSLHSMMKRLVYPKAFKASERFKISEENRLFLIETMGKVPSELGYDKEHYYDGYVKFFIQGDTQEDLSESIKIHNKVGYAYGYLTDCAYIVNKQTNKEYIITATIHVNKNQVFNDNNYEYESVGIPFLAELGRQLIISK